MLVACFTVRSELGYVVRRTTPSLKLVVIKVKMAAIQPTVTVLLVDEWPPQVAACEDENEVQLQPAISRHHVGASGRYRPAGPQRPSRRRVGLCPPNTMPETIGINGYMQAVNARPIPAIKNKPRVVSQ